MMKIDSEKQIMNTIFIVEGEYEKTLLKNIFVKTLGYSIINQGNRDKRYLQFRRIGENTIKGNIAVFCTEESDIKSIINQQHIDNVIQVLVQEYSFDIRNSCVFYLFDRDPKSNTDNTGIRQLVQSLSNPYENADFEYGGLMLLSYPCVESYKISNFVNDTYSLTFAIGADVKTDFGTNPDIQDNKINENTVLKAATEMLIWYEKNGLNLDYENIDYKIIDGFDKQEDFFNDHKKYQLMSTLSCALIELGIISLD